jgi:hypothetical protein
VTRTVLCKKTATGGSKRVRAMSNDRPGAVNAERMAQQSFEEFCRNHYDAISRWAAEGLETTSVPI